MPEAKRPAAQKREQERTITGRLCDDMPYSAREAFKRLRTNVLLAFPEDESLCRVIGVTSAQISAGKSTVSINLAYSFAELGKRVLLIDGDMRRPSIEDKLDIAPAAGLSEVLSGTANLNEVVLSYQSSVNEHSFNVIASGEIPANPSELLNSGRFRKLIQVVSSSFDYVIIDLPPVNVVVDAVNVSKITDGMIVVLRENYCPRYVLDDCMDQLKYAKANVLGFVMNGCVEGARKRYQYNYQGYRYSR